MTRGEADPLVVALRRQVLEAASRFLPHAIRQMSRRDRMITAAEVRSVIMRGEIVEDYPEDARGHSCLLAGSGDAGQNVHVACSPKDEYLAVITAYVPDPRDWEPNFRVRRQL